MAKHLTSTQPVVDDRGAAFGRLASRILEMLNEAVEHRRSEGETLNSIAGKMGCHRSLLSRALNGTTSNLTIRTISDVLWAANYEPQDFRADPIEILSPNYIPYGLSQSQDDDAIVNAHSTQEISFVEKFEIFKKLGKKYNSYEVTTR
jgi:transcriptional regulator with XRE-family HTH domain